MLFPPQYSFPSPSYFPTTASLTFAGSRTAPTTLFTPASAFSAAISPTLSPFSSLWYRNTLDVCVAPTQNSKKFTLAKNRFRGLMMKHHLVQIAPVHISAMFCVSESSLAGRVKSDAPASTSPH